jgi:hypothetical protein
VSWKIGAARCWSLKARGSMSAVGTFETCRRTRFHLAREQRKLAAILTADVVGYSHLIRPTLENILRRHAKHDLTDRLVVQYAPLALLRDRVDVAQMAFERIFLEHRHRAAIVKQRIDDLP